MPSQVNDLDLTRNGAERRWRTSRVATRLIEAEASGESFRGSLSLGAPPHAESMRLRSAASQAAGAPAAGSRRLPHRGHSVRCKDWENVALERLESEKKIDKRREQLDRKD